MAYSLSLTAHIMHTRFEKLQQQQQQLLQKTHVGHVCGAYKHKKLAKGLTSRLCIWKQLSEQTRHMPGNTKQAMMMTHQPDLRSSFTASNKAITINLRSMVPRPHTYLQQCMIIVHLIGDTR